MCEARQLTELAAKHACGMLGIFSFSANVSRFGVGVSNARAIFQAAVVRRTNVLLANADLTT